MCVFYCRSLLGSLRAGQEAGSPAPQGDLNSPNNTQPDTCMSTETHFYGLTLTSGLKSKDSLLYLFQISRHSNDSYLSSDDNVY